MFDFGPSGPSTQFAGLVSGIDTTALTSALPESAIEFLADPGALAAAFLEVQGRSKESVIAFDRGTSEPKPTGRENAQRAALDRGVHYRIIYGPSAFASGTSSPMISVHGLPKTSMRVSSLAPTRLLVRDSEEALVVTTSGPSNECTGVRVRSAWFARFLLDTFETIWDSALPVSRERLHASRMLDSAEQEILELLATGLTDESIARLLGVSLRTIQRKVQGIQRSVGATSRFQLGAMTAA